MPEDPAKYGKGISPGLNIHLQHVLSEAVLALEAEINAKVWPPEVRGRFEAVAGLLKISGYAAWHCARLVAGEITVDEFLKGRG